MWTDAELAALATDAASSFVADPDFATLDDPGAGSNRRALLRDSLDPSAVAEFDLSNLATSEPTQKDELLVDAAAPRQSTRRHRHRTQFRKNQQTSLKEIATVVLLSMAIIAVIALMARWMGVLE